MAEREIIERIGLVSAARTGMWIVGLLGFVAGTIWGLTAAFFSAALTAATGMSFSGFGLTALILLPAAGLVGGALTGAFVCLLCALFYNLGAGLFGGVDISVEREKNDQPRMFI